MSENGKVGLSSPWCEFYNLLKAFFANDRSITITDEGDEKDGKYVIDISCAKVNVLASLQKLIGTQRSYGNITVEIKYISTSDAICDEEVIDALADTGYLFDVQEAEIPLGTFTFAIMRPKVVQFYSDDISDLYGNTNLTAQDALARLLDPSKDFSNLKLTTENLRDLPKEDEDEEE